MNSKVKISVMYYLSIIICSIILILSIIEIKNLKINIENMPIGVLIPIVLIFFINMYIDTFIHELGHFISGKLMGFKLVKLIIFPYELCKKNNKYKFLKTEDLSTIGGCIMLPIEYENLYTRFIIYFAGGFLLNLFVIANIVVVGYFFINETTNILTKFIYCIFLLVSEFNLISNIIPRQFNGIDNDGNKIKRIVINSSKFNLYLENLSITAQFIEGVRPRDIKSKVLNREALDLVDIIDNEMELYLIYIYTDGEDAKSLNNVMELIDGTIDNYKGERKKNILIELLYYYSYRKRDISKAREKYNNIEKYKNDNMKINELRAIVAYKAFVDRDYEDALKYSEKIFKLVNLEEDSGLISFEKIQLEKILKEIHHLYME